MLKDYRIIKRLSSALAEAANGAAESVLRDYANHSGREEEITGQLRGEVNRRLLDNAKAVLDGAEISGCKISIATFKKKQESSVGADLAGVLEMTIGATQMSKAFLAQAKVGSEYFGGQDQLFVRATSQDVVAQADAMLRISSDSFVFLYSPSGIVCIPAFQVALARKATIDTASHPFRSFGSFIEEFVKCFIGDNRITPSAVGAQTLEEYTERLGANGALRVAVRLNEDRHDVGERVRDRGT